MGSIIQHLHLRTPPSTPFLRAHHAVHAVAGEHRVHGALLDGRGGVDHSPRPRLGHEVAGGGHGRGDRVQGVCL